jgi:hypothetical protein
MERSVGGDDLVSVGLGVGVVEEVERGMGS